MFIHIIPGDSDMECVDEYLNAQESQTQADAEGLFVTAYTPFDDGPISETSYILHMAEPAPHAGEWTEFTPDSRIATQWAEDTTIGLGAQLELGKKWLCVDFPHHAEQASGMEPHPAQTGTTVSHKEDWLGDPFTVLKGVDGDFDVAFRDLRPEDFRYLPQETVNDPAERKRINDCIEKAIASGEIVSYRNPEDHMHLWSLNRFSVGNRRLTVANYSTVQGAWDFVYIIENDNITPLNLLNSYYSEVFFFALNDGHTYMLHREGRYGMFFTTIKRLDLENAGGDITIFKFSKATD
jgi:hypothetical protein